MASIVQPTRWRVLLYYINKELRGEVQLSARTSVAALAEAMHFVAPEDVEVIHTVLIERVYDAKGARIERNYCAFGG